MSGDILSKLLNRMVELAAGKKQMIEEVKLLTCSQSGLLAPEKVDEHLKLIQTKQRYIDGIRQIDSEMLFLREEMLRAAGLSSWAEVEKSFGVKWKAFEDLQREITSLIRETRDLDEQNRRIINGEYQKLRKSIESLRATRGSVKAYRRPAVQSGGYFIDKKK